MGDCVRDGRPALSNAKKRLVGSKYAKPETAALTGALELPDIPPPILKSDAQEAWKNFIAPMAKAGVFQESDRIGCTVIADCMARLFSTTERDGKLFRIEEKEGRLLSETLLDFLHAYGLTAKSREQMGFKPHAPQPESRQR